jgi:hypothetical protein
LNPAARRGRHPFAYHYHNGRRRNTDQPVRCPELRHLLLVSGSTRQSVATVIVVTSVTYASIDYWPRARAMETRWCPSRTKCSRPTR